MKEIVLKQYIEVRRVVSVRVEDDQDELDAAKMLDEASLDNEKLGPNMKVVDSWNYIDDRGIENENGVTILNGEDGDENG